MYWRTDGGLVSSGKPMRNVITVLMDLLVILAIFLTIVIVVRFFGALAAQTWGSVVVRVGALLTVPFGVDAIKTPYGGVLDVNAALTVGVMLLIEWGLGVARSRA